MTDVKRVDDELYKAMLEANKKGVKLSDKNTKNVGDCVSDRTMKNIVETLSQYRW